MMNCTRRRNIFELFTIYTCERCPYKREDEFIYIGHNLIAIYYLYNNCPTLGVNPDYIIVNSNKLRILMKDAILNNDQIIFLFLDDFKLEDYYDVFLDILDSELSIQIICC